MDCFDFLRKSRNDSYTIYVQAKAKKLDLKKIKTFVLLGFGKTTISTAKYLSKNFKDKKIKISELKEKENFDLNTIEDLEKSGIEFEFGKQTEAFIFEKDTFIVISPGIPPKVELIQKIFNSDIDHGTDLDLFAAALSKEQNYVSITGTNGKTTTTSILSHIFNSPSLGNIGTPFLEFDRHPAKQSFASDVASKEIGIMKIHDSSNTNNLKEEKHQTYHYPNFACEISSFQAFYSKHFQDLKIPKVSIFLNFTADHLDWHRDLNEYHDAKAKLFCQSEKEENYWILNFDDPKVKNLGLNNNFKENTKTKVCYFATDDISYTLSESCPYVAYIKNKRLYLAQLGDASGADLAGDAIVSVNDNDDYFVELPLLKLEELKLVGKHNYTNILAASLAAYLMKFDLGYIIEKLEDFTPVPHRLEYIREIGNNRVYNDSKATNPDSTIKAIESFDQSILILGGKEKNLDLTNFLNRVSKKAYAVVAIGEIKDKIYNKLRELNFEKVRRAEGLEEALSICVLYTDNNNYPIVLSPASSSFDMFKGFEDRGDQFRELVLNY